MANDPGLSVRPVVLVTGGNGGLGRAVVRHFVEGGATVHVPVFPGEDTSELEAVCAPLRGELTLHPVGDLADPDAVATLFKRLTPPHVLLHLAGGFAMAPIQETSIDQWRSMFEMNVTSAFLVARSAFTAMQHQGGGRIAFVSALPAIQGGASGMSAYGAAKAAVLNLAQTLAREGAPHNITANAILPSIMDTPANRSAMPDADRTHWIQPDEVAELLAFLVSKAGGAITGAAIPLTRTP
jgi:NAD(P)-dependent dehydrogenase (short-subunit alcohol dehydrogenase family)